MSTPNRVTRLIAGGLLAATLAATPALAQTAPASGGATGNQGVQGGSGAPGGGTGTPGAVVNGTTATGIGTSATHPKKSKHMATKAMKHTKKSAM